MTATLPGPARSRMRQEVEEQPEALRRTLDALLPAVPDLAVLAPLLPAAGNGVVHVVVTDPAAGGPSARPAAVVFDLDGTLVLSEERNAEAWRSFLARYDLPLTPARFRQVTGRRGFDSLPELAAELPDRFGGRSPVEVVDEVRETDAATPFGQVQEVPGARALVRRLAEQGVLSRCAPRRPGRTR